MSLAVVLSICFSFFYNNETIVLEYYNCYKEEHCPLRHVLLGVVAATVAPVFMAGCCVRINAVIKCYPGIGSSRVRATRR